MKPWTKARNNNKYMKSHSKRTYQLLFQIWAEKRTIMQEASGSSTAQTPQGESVAKPETPMPTILSIACKYKVRGNLFSP